MTWDFRRLLPGHGWQTRPGCKTIVLDRGAVQLDYPRSWLVVPTSGSIALFDRQPPAYENRLEVSYFRGPPVDWSGFPLVDLVDSVTSRPRKHASCGPLREEIRRGIELAWRELYFSAEPPRDGVCFRVCVARHGGVHCLITYESLDTGQCCPDDVWECVLDTLVLDRGIADPARGPNRR
jgi:hypothetical protein